MTRTPRGLRRLAAGLLVACTWAPATGCTDDPPPTLLGGPGTIHDATPNAFSYPVPSLERERELRFFVGNSFFNQNWVRAPASTTARDGLGPMFNARSCASCHPKDGRGRPPEGVDDTGTGLIVRLGGLERDPESGVPLPDPTYGGQIQDRALDGVAPEARIVATYEERPGRFADGTPYSLREPTYEIVEPRYGPLDADVRTSARLAPQMIGLGLLEAVPETDIVGRADPDDVDGDGISGRPNRVWDVSRGETRLGRFGWKASQPTVRQQVARAFLDDMGITTGTFPEENCGPAREACRGAPSGGQPEIEDDDFQKVVLYASSLAVPAMRDAHTPGVRQGAAVFEDIGCAACHVPTLRTGEHREIPGLSGLTIHPYTDLLLHDMGPGLADGRPDLEATGSEWRTPPLWGIGLIRTVNGRAHYLHDGRARSLAEAVLWHGGEAQAARDAFASLPSSRRAALLRFLEAL